MGLVTATPRAVDVVKRVEEVANDLKQLLRGQEVAP